MAKGLIFVVAMVMVCLAPAVQGTSHLTFNNTLGVNITRDGCGATKLCVETPAGCDPSGNGSCLFGSIDSNPTRSNVDLDSEIRGYSDGVISLGLTPNSSMALTMVFICGNTFNSNNNIFFSTMVYNKSANTFTPAELRVTNIRGTVTNNTIRCEFKILNVTGTTFEFLLGNGTLNGSTVGQIDLFFTAGFLNVSNPASNLNQPTAAPTTSDAFRPQAVSILLCVLVWLFSLTT